MKILRLARLSKFGLVLALTSLLTSTILTTEACAPKTIVTQPGKVAYTKDQIVLRLQELSNAVIDAQKQGLVSAADAFSILEWISGDANAKGPGGVPRPTTGIVQALNKASSIDAWIPVAVVGYTNFARAALQKSSSLSKFVPILDGILGVS